MMRVYDQILTDKTELGTGILKVIVKDNFAIAGKVTTCGSEALSNTPPATKHAEVVQRLLDAKCRVIGRATMHELAFGMTGVNKWAGSAPNPKFPELMTGGSSSGSASAVAVKFCDFSLGTDTGGSIRLPAACCGVYGFKPTYGRVSRQGISPFSSSLDCVGVLARDANMISKAMEIITPYFNIKSIFPPLSSLKIAVLSLNLNVKVEQAINGFIRQLPCKTNRIKLDTFHSAFDAAKTLMGFEMYQEYGYLLASDKLGEDVRARLSDAAAISTDDYDTAISVKHQFINELQEVFGFYDLLLLPTLPDFPLTKNETHNGLTVLSLSRFVRPFNLSGHPAMAVPIDSVDGKPMSLQIVGGLEADEFVCQFAEIIQQQFIRSEY